MKRPLLTLALAAAACLATTTAHAQTGPRVYIMMKDGKLSEMDNGKKTAVTADISLTNGTTVHPDGSINDRDGHLRKLEEGQYMTMDGRIRELKNMAGKPPAPTTH
jgi:hypothetical protein